MFEKTAVYFTVSVACYASAVVGFRLGNKFGAFVANRFIKLDPA